MLLIRPIILRKITNVLKQIIPAAVLLHVSPASNIEHCSFGDSINWKLKGSS